MLNSLASAGVVDSRSISYARITNPICLIGFLSGQRDWFTWLTGSGGLIEIYL